MRGKRRRELHIALVDRIDQETQRRMDNEFAWVMRSLNGTVRVTDLRNIGRTQTRVARLLLPLTAVNGRAQQLAMVAIRADHTVPPYDTAFAIDGCTLQPIPLPLDCQVRLA